MAPTASPSARPLVGTPWEAMRGWGWFSLPSRQCAARLCEQPAELPHSTFENGALGHSRAGGMHGIASAVETAPEWLATAKSTDWVGSLKPWTQFAGFGEGLPFRLPSPGSLAARVMTNFALFLPNYVIVSPSGCRRVQPGCAVDQRGAKLLVPALFAFLSSRR